MKIAHTDSEYERELTRLRNELLSMAGRVEKMIRESVQALVERDDALARATIDSDREVDLQEVEIDKLCLRILARRQPVASDLRVLMTAIRMVTDLERMGDLAVNVCERALELNREPPLKQYIDIPRMAELAQGMVRETLDAFVAGDAEAAQRVIARDEEVDALYAQVFRELLTFMMEDTGTVFRATRLQSIAKYLERLGDHATNLGEMVVFLVKGEDIRHSS